VTQGESKASVSKATSQSQSNNPWFLEDFEDYGGVSGDPTRDFRKDILKRYEERYNGYKKAEIVVDPTFGQIWRQHNGLRRPEKCHPGGGTGRTLVFPENAGQEIWVEAFVRFSPTYKTKWKCGKSNFDHKFIFFGRLNPGERDSWRFKVGSWGNSFALKAAEQTYSNQYRNGNSHLNHGALPNRCMNGAWHRWRWHARAASVQGVADGHFEWRWVRMDDPDVVYRMPASCRGTKKDAEMKYLAATPTEHHDGFNKITFGLTFNTGPFEPQYWEYGEIRVWKDDPGWGW
jgi:hypothetical protein